MIPEAVIDEIRGRIDAVALIGRHVELKRSGRTWKGCCPFHGERTPSFHVYPEDRHWKCYGCGEYGDVFKFLQKLQGKEFPEVVRALAMEVGVEIPEREEDSADARRRREERRQVLAACDAAARYFAARLASRHGEAARAYLASRGFEDETVRTFRLGVASPAWDDLTARLAEKGVSLEALEKAGLVTVREGGRGDFFRGRLMIPIAGLDGEVIGFGGRLLPGAPDRMGKYINTRETAVYKKSRVLYGIELAREHVRKTRSAVLVEGYFDVIGLHQAGMRNAVAVCGTALTPEHVDLLRRCDCRELTVLFDGDVAGLAAPGKAAAAILPSGLSAKVALLPSGGGKTDPDEFARAYGLAALERLLAEAVPLTEFLLERAVAGHCGPAPAQAPVERRLAAFRELRPYIALAPAGLARTMFEERVAKRLDVSAAALAAEVEAPESPPRFARPAAIGATPTPSAARGAAARTPPALGSALDALALVASFPALAEVAAEERLAEVFEGTPLEEVARGVIAGTLAPEDAARRLAEVLPEAAAARARKLLDEARPDAEGAERELRKATVLAKIERLGREIDRLNAEVALAGRPVPVELITAMQVAIARRRDLEKRRDGRRPG
ncbi:MAG TPA: DNA primase [Anaeromyxobacteraceae bacterium]|nr:DNA primase [Anaeromyxobacteraceae bacterium]